MSVQDDVLKALGRLPQGGGAEGLPQMDLSQLTQIASNGVLMLQVMGKLIETLSTILPFAGSMGSFACTPLATVTISNAFVTASSRIFLFPTSATAALRQAGANPLYVSARTAGVSFAITTAAGGVCATTDTFDYLVLNPSV